MAEREEKLGAQVTSGREAKDLWEHPLLQGALAARRQSSVDLLARDGLTDDDLRRIYAGHKAQVGLESFLRKVIKDGEDAATLLDAELKHKKQSGQG